MTHLRNNGNRRTASSLRRNILWRYLNYVNILGFLNPWADPRGSGFQIIQAQIALGSGGIFGLGLGQSKQKLFYLPAAHTDFIFCIISEELGILGAASIIVLFLLFFWQGMVITKNVRVMSSRTLDIT